MQRYFAKEKKDNHFILDDSDIKHIKIVMRMKENDEIEVVYDSKLYLCCLENVNQNINIIIKKQLKHEEKKQLITLITPILKEQKMDYILQKATELGVDYIIPVITERTVVKLDEKGIINKTNRWLKICKEASEQSKRTTIPKIEMIIKLKDLKRLDGLSILCSTTTKNYIKKAFQNSVNYDRINIVFGPEGGISTKEENFLNEIGFESVSLGNRILRTETVPLYVLSVLNYINME